MLVAFKGLLVSSLVVECFCWLLNVFFCFYIIANLFVGETSSPCKGTVGIHSPFGPLGMEIEDK